MVKFLDLAGLTALWDKILYKLSLKQNKLKATIGYMYRSNISGSGSLSIQGNSGQFPRLSEAGTYIVKTRMSSATSSYTLSVNYGGISYSLTSENGVIEDERELTLPAGATWAGSVTPVAASTICEVAVIAIGSVTELAPVATSGNYNDLANKPSIPAAQIQSDWNQTNTSSKDYIKNKPDLSIYAETNDLADVATSGSYNDLTDTPTIPEDSNLVHKTGDETIAGDKTFTGNIYGDLYGDVYTTHAEISDGFITLPVDGQRGALTLVSDYGYGNAQLIVGNSLGNPEGQTPEEQATGGWTQIYNEATDKTLQDELDARNNVKANWTETNSSSDAYIQNKPTLATVATSGSYNDLSGKPTLPEYCANVPLSLEMNYIREPEVKTIKINGSTTNAASTNNCVLLYDTTNNCLKFVFN